MRIISHVSIKREQAFRTQLLLQTATHKYKKGQLIKIHELIGCNTKFDMVLEEVIRMDN